MMEYPLVSIIITSFNYGRYLSEAIESALKQTYPHIEVIVVDDGSTDNTKDTAKRYPVSYFYQPNQGVAVARNNGIKLSKGEYFVCLDADDKLAPEYVRKTIKLMMEDPEVGFVLVASKVWYEDIKVENIWMPDRIFSKYSIHAGWKGFPGCAFFRRIAFDSLEYGFDSYLPAYEDLDVCFRLLCKGWKVKTLFEPLHWHRIHENSLDPKNPQQRKYAERIICQKYPFRRIYRKVYALYENTLGRIITLIAHPIEYLEGVKRKVKVIVWLKMHQWFSQKNQQGAQKIVQEHLFTVDLLIKWYNDEKLRYYYKKLLRTLENLLESIVVADKMNENYQK